MDKELKQSFTYMEERICDHCRVQPGIYLVTAPSDEDGTEQEYHLCEDCIIEYAEWAAK